MVKKIIFLVVFLVGIGIVSYAYTLYSKSRAAADWPTTTGRIVSSAVDSYRSRSGSGSSSRTTTMYRAEISFQYTVKGRSYVSDQVSFGDHSSSTSGGIREIVNRYPAASTATVYYDPADPATAILEPGKLGGLWIPFVVGGMFLLVGILGFFGKVQPVPRRTDE